MSVTTDPRAVFVSLGRARDRALKAAQQSLEGKLSGEGTGIKHSTLPNRSSRAGEYPSRQSGETAEGIVTATTGPLSGRVSAVGGASLELHTRPEADGGRPFMVYALHDPEYLEAVHEGVRRA